MCSIFCGDDKEWPQFDCELPQLCGPNFAMASGDGLIKRCVVAFPMNHPRLVDLDDAPIPNVNVTMKMALSGEEAHRGSYPPNDDALSIGHFIGIAKKFAKVEESKISLVIGTEDFNANWNTARIFFLEAVLLLDNNCNHCSI